MNPGAHGRAEQQRSGPRTAGRASLGDVLAPSRFGDVVHREAIEIAAVRVTSPYKARRTAIHRAPPDDVLQLSE